VGTPSLTHHRFQSRKAAGHVLGKVKEALPEQGVVFGGLEVVMSAVLRVTDGISVENALHLGYVNAGTVDGRWLADTFAGRWLAGRSHFTPRS